MLPLLIWALLDSSLCAQEPILFFQGPGTEAYVSATSYQNKCNQHPLTPRPATAVICDPDPFQEICKAQPSQVKKKESRAETQFDQLRAQAEAALPGCKNETALRYLKTDESSDAYWAAVKKCVAEKVSQTSQKMVANQIHRAVEIFAKVVATSGDARIASHANQLRDELLLCTSKPLIDVDYLFSISSFSLKALSPRFLSANIQSEIHGGQMLDQKLLQSLEGKAAKDYLLLRKCGLHLSPTAWSSCEDGDSACMMALFHEMGHLMDPCIYRATAGAASAGKAKSEESSNDDYAKFRELFLSHSEKKNADIEKALVQSTECLSFLSQPHFGIPNACGLKVNKGLRAFALETGGRCAQVEFGALQDYPSQWPEASADFWGASALGAWLKESQTSVAARRESLLAPMRAYCASSSDIHADGDAASNQSIPEPGKPAPELSCTSLPSNPNLLPLPPAWPDHSSWATRFNRHYLRNSDLRAALGCELASAGPACSPRGTIVTPIISK